MTRGKLIFLNGPSSAGKTTLAKALQKTLDEPFLFTGTDHFFLMLPSWSWETGQAFQMVVGDDGAPTELKTGQDGLRLIGGMVVAVAALVEAGHNVIVETGFWGDELQICLDGWARLAPLLVGVRCPLPVLEEREAARGNRIQGLARLQDSLIPRHGIYDIELDTSALPVEQCTEQIKLRL